MSNCIECDAIKAQKERVYEKARLYAKENNLLEIVIVKTKNGFLGFRSANDESLERLTIVEYLYIGKGSEV